jgi:integrase
VRAGNLKFWFATHTRLRFARALAHQSTRIDLGWRDGKRRSKAIYGRTRRLAADALRDAMKAAQEGTLVSDERQTVEQFLTNWLRDVARSRVRPRTYVSYESAVTRDIVPTLGKHRLSQLTPQHVQGWLATLEQAGVTTACRRYARVVFRNAINTALRWRVVTRNVATLVDAPRAVSKEIRPLTALQAKHLLMTAKGDTLDAFVAVALSCGVRRGEILGLKWADVELEAATVQVRSAVQRFGGDPATRRPLLAEWKRLRKALQRARFQACSDDERAALQKALQAVRIALRDVRTSLQVVELKSVRSHRKIALPNVAIAALRRHRVRQLEARLAGGSSWREQGFVFTTGIGTLLEPRKVTREFKALLTNAGLPHIRLHDLRHSCATLLLAQGVSPRVVMETLGHSQISLTLNTYSHVLPALQRDAATKMDGIFAGF